MNMNSQNLNEYIEESIRCPMAHIVGNYIEWNIATSIYNFEILVDIKEAIVEKEINAIGELYTLGMQF